jgi:hypothetical protein
MRATVIELAQRAAKISPSSMETGRLHRLRPPISPCGFVAVEDVKDQARSAGQVQELPLVKPDQATAGRGTKTHTTTVAIRLMFTSPPLQLTQSLHHATLVLLFNIGGHHFDRLVLHH